MTYLMNRLQGSLQVPGVPVGFGAAHVLVPLGAVASLLPFVSPGIALLAGVSIGIAFGNPFAKASRALSRGLLSLSVVGLGAGMDLRVVERAGVEGVAYTVVGIAACLALGTLLARLLHVGTNTGALISIGTAICGGSAIAAVAPTLRAKEDEITVALATVFVLNAVALFVFPAMGRAVGLDEQRFGLWAALAIHDTSSVVGASMAYGPHALEVATTVKLARALWIVPVTMGVAAWVARRDRSTGVSVDAHAVKARRPWFIAGFLGAAALFTFLPGFRPIGRELSALSHHAMAATLFLIGASLTRPALRAVGARPMIQGVALWVSVASLSLAALVFRIIG
jgi:uncharacterized integral membrane protein (TIGR00698 family)